VVACAGTTSVSSVDPLSAIADLCERELLWLHVDAAYAGSAAVLPAVRPLFAGWERADSVVFNPHKWMFVPLECTALLFRGMERVRRAFSVVPNYLETPEGAGGTGSVREYMDYGIQLGRRFRSLKMWMTLRLFGARGVRERIRHHLTHAAPAALPGRWIPPVAPVPFSVVSGDGPVSPEAGTASTGAFSRRSRGGRASSPSSRALCSGGDRQPAHQGRARRPPAPRSEVRAPGAFAQGWTFVGTGLHGVVN
jgi:hypothetical protein